MLDPDDLGVWVWRTCSVGHLRWTGTVVTCPTELMEQMSTWNNLQADAVQAICGELESSIRHQEYAYAHRADLPKLDIAKSRPIDWEQSIVEGHATHPMHRARHAMPPLARITPSTEFKHVRLGFVAVPRAVMAIQGDYDSLLMPVVPQRRAQSRGRRPTVDGEREVIVPVHPLHMPAIRAKFKFARPLPFSAAAEAQASLRTVSPMALEASGYDIKLPLGAKTSSALRTVSTWSAFLGPQLTNLVPQMLQANPNAPLVAGEPASIILRDADNDVAKYLACIVRVSAQKLCQGNRDARAIVAASLTERNAAGRSNVVELLNLHSVEQRLAFLRAYVSKLFSAFLPSILTHGFTFEAHQQNTLVVLSAATGLPIQFMIRDFGGIMVHMETFKEAAGFEIPMLLDNSTTAADLDEVYGVAYHTIVQCQIHRLVRALGLHYEGDGWQVVREEFEKCVPHESPLYVAWTRREVRLKSFITMKLGGLYRDYVYGSVPNILFYRNEQQGVVF
ncbi:hypothetical protein DL89DRAFT_225288 [Linderina pennispora]|uniref:Aerobactin siderophore biosynthesis IucA/IucC N-terminal domain-containing protein n=1 Tax=Linderina pennispora TaxID=61395 RepID=A0A1Y1W301_9FUNG|nr:uncharacterized protein DL89DRAFT_225288 [Linderina pennispora]ORX67752.1 hypothetical protein DL89DRAFT_225288 [Linderina pennispora]